VDPFAPGKARLKVFFFVSIECPISNRYAPEVRRYCEEFAPKGVEFALVYSDPDVPVSSIRKHVAEYRYPCPAWRDPKHELMHRARVRIVPECAVFTGSGRLIYHGRIDNRYVDFGQTRPAPNQRELQEAIQGYLRGTPVPVTGPPAVGCPIPELP